MRYRKIFVLAILAGGIVVLSAGRPGSPSAAVRVVSYDAVPLQPRELGTGSVLGLPARISIANDRLIVLDAASAAVLHVFDRGTGGHLESLGPRGRGPGEFEGARAIDVLPGGESFWVHDANLQRSTRFRLESRRNDARREEAILTFGDGLGVLEPLRTKSGDIVATGLFEEGRLGHFDAEAAFVGASGPLPDTDRDLPASAVQFLHQGRLAVSPSRDAYAASSIFFSRIELFDSAGAPIGLADAPVVLDPEILTRRRDGGPVSFVDPSSPLGYIDLAVTDRAVYGLFSGREPAEYDGDAGYGREVHVFSWAGEFLGAYDVGHDAVALAVTDDDGEMYVIAHDPMPRILAASLPAFRAATAPAKGPSVETADLGPATEM